ncbi:phage/plasmid primase, P4 family [Deinococcus radiomollis]|uniref:phage/plasmid primase, P4 family n=1 Tax=Deinococcus radiomollis TaxID=468916 RepID=UPI00389121A3
MNPIPMSPVQFVALLYGGATPPKGFVEIRYLPARTRSWMPWPAFEGHPDEYHLSSAPKSQDVYLGVSLRKEKGEQKGIGGAANCHPTHLVWTDIDLKDHPEFTGGQLDVLSMTADELTEYKAALLAMVLALCESRNLPPRCIVDSAHGLQVYWARRARSTPEDTERFNLGLLEVFGGDPKSYDVARILRLPGSRNLKNKQRPLDVQVIWADPEAWVEDSALPVPAPVEKPKREPAPTSTPVDGESVIESWNAQHPIGEVLERYGYQREDSKTYTRPGKDASGRDVRLLENKKGVLCSYHHSSNDPIAGHPSDKHLREPFDLFTEYEHGGDFKAAVRAASVELGLQKRWENKPQAFGIGTIGGKDAGQPTSTKELPAKPTLSDYRDLTLDWCAEHGHIYRYHQTRRSWWQYQRGVYLEVLDEVIQQRADKILQGYGYTNLKNNIINEVLSKISREEGVAALDVDQTAWELNTRTGILDLTDRTLTEHTPEYFSTIQSAAAYRPEAVAHEWLSFLREAVPEEADRLLLQQFAGLCLTGDTSPQRALLLVGDGGTGKSTFVRVLQAVLGNLATSSALENIKDGSFLVGGLVGKRLCVVSELQRNVDWLPFKRITGEDSISVDVKNKTPFTVKLDLKLIILSNVMPFLGDDTSNTSLMRRFLPVAFNVKPAIPDPTLEARLTQHDELPGILNWMLEGLEILKSNGMRFPASDGASLAREIVEESNRVISFLREECTYSPGVQLGFSDLYTAYRKWCGETGHKPLSSTSFTKQLIAAGRHFERPIDRFKDRQGRGFINVTLSTLPSGWEDE